MSDTVYMLAYKGGRISQKRLARLNPGFIDRHPEIDWDPNEIIIGFEKLLKYKDHPNVNWTKMTEIYGRTYYNDHPNLSWDMRTMSSILIFENIHANLKLVRRNIDLNWEYVKNNPDLGWDFDVLSFGKPPISVVRTLMHKNWRISVLVGKNKYMYGLFPKSPIANSNMACYGKRRHIITFKEQLEEFFGDELIDRITHNENLTRKDLKDIFGIDIKGPVEIKRGEKGYKDCANYKIRWYEVDMHPDLPWDIKKLTLTTQIPKHKKAATYIQKWWTNIIYNPHHPAGKKYLMRKFKKTEDEMKS